MFLWKSAACRQDAASLNAFEKIVHKVLLSSTGDARAVLLNLQTNLQRFTVLQKDPEQRCKAFAELEQARRRICRFCLRSSDFPYHRKPFIYLTCQRTS